MVWRKPVSFGMLMLRSYAAICTGESINVLSDTGSNRISSPAERVSSGLTYFQLRGIRNVASY